MNVVYDAEQLLPISALQHLIFCERQCALIHVERLWAENRLTVEGNQLHRRAHEGPDEYREKVTIARGMPVRSLKLGIYGVADVVEFHFESQSKPQSGSLPNVEKTSARQDVPFAQRDREMANHTGRPNIPLVKPDALISVIPVEYKRGQPKRDDSDRVQVCAQALCLEEMLGRTVTTAHLFYGRRKRRTEVELDRTLRVRTNEAIQRLHQLIDQRETPRARRQPKCDNCSLLHLCLPDGTGPQKSARRHFERRLSSTLAASGPQSDLDFDSF